MSDKKAEEFPEPPQPGNSSVFYNPHDIIGVKGIIEAQSKELDRKMVCFLYRMYKSRTLSWN